MHCVSSGFNSRMKGGSAYSFRGKHFSFALIALVFMTVFLWSLEKNPLVTSLLSGDDHFYMPTSDAILSASHITEDLVKPRDHPIDEDSHVHEVTESASGLLSDGSDVKSTVSFKPEETERDSTRTTRSFGNKENKHAYHTDDMSTSAKKKVCNYAKGRWVVDNSRPLYSGSQCKQWLSEMWACRLTDRPDFSYERYRWQPENCEMPEFDPSKFLQRMQDKTIAFVGDSLGRQQFQSLMCMVTAGEEHPEVEDVGPTYGFSLSPGAVRPSGWAFRFPATNTTILYHWSSCLCHLEPLNATSPTTEVAMHLDRPASFLQTFLPQLDIIILNTGHHWNRGKLNANRWVMYAGGSPVRDRRLAMMGNAKNFTIHSVARWLDGELRHHRHVKAFFRTISPRHFFNGEWNTGGSCENTVPLAKGSSVTQEESSDPTIAGAVEGTRVRLLDITALSTLRDEGHISRYSVKAAQGVQDCLHWCLPGIPDTWNEIVAAQI